jgi:lincosamide nucleotidyltransferase A/C/D/E
VTDFGRHLMSVESVVVLVEALLNRGAQPCVGGGWAVDGLLREQTREHSDLDPWLPAAQLELLIAAFRECGLDRIIPWGGDRPWNFVLHDGVRRRVDLHPYEPPPNSSIHYGSVVYIRYPRLRGYVQQETPASSRSRAAI